MKSRPINHFIRTRFQEWPQVNCRLILGLPDGRVYHEKTLSENNMHKFGGNLDNIPPLLHSLPSNQLHTILLDELFLILGFFCFKALDDPIKVLHYNSELYLFIAREDLTNLNSNGGHCGNRR